MKQVPYIRVRNIDMKFTMHGNEYTITSDDYIELEANDKIQLKVSGVTIVVNNGQVSITAPTLNISSSAVNITGFVEVDTLHVKQNLSVDGSYPR